MRPLADQGKEKELWVDDLYKLSFMYIVHYDKTFLSKIDVPQTLVNHVAFKSKPLFTFSSAKLYWTKRKSVTEKCITTYWKKLIKSTLKK